MAVASTGNFADVLDEDRQMEKKSTEYILVPLALLVIARFYHFLPLFLATASSIWSPYFSFLFDCMRWLLKGISILWNLAKYDSTLQVLHQMYSTVECRSTMFVGDGPQCTIASKPKGRSWTSCRTYTHHFFFASAHQTFPVPRVSHRMKIWKMI